MKIQVNNKKLTDRERATDQGILTIDIVKEKTNINGFPSLESYEKEFFKEQVANRRGISTSKVTDAMILDQCKEIKSEYFKNMCEEKIILGFVASNGHFYRTNRDDQTNLIGQKDDLSDDPNEIIYWKTEDIGYIPHTQADWLTVYREAFAHKKQKLFTYDAIKKEVSMATSHEELLEITW